jgi:acetyl esterase/lipase
LVYLHGGAFYFGPVKEHWLYLAEICRRTQFAGIMVDYGIAPQRPYPVGMDEIEDLISQLELPVNWAILGDSSGAAMAVSTVLRLKRVGAKIPQKLILMSPWIDMTLQNPAIELTEKDDVMMTVERLSNAARAYAGGSDLRDPDLSPMFADLAGLPPVLIQIGTADLLLGDCRKFFMRCQDAGVDASYEEYPNAFHDFMMLSFLPEARRALASQAAFLVDQ